MAEEHYVADDGVLPILSLSSPCEIRLDITDDKVLLTVGPRDYEWVRHDPDLKSSGTTLYPQISQENE